MTRNRISCDHHYQLVHDSRALALSRSSALALSSSQALKLSSSRALKLIACSASASLDLSASASTCQSMWCTTDITCLRENRTFTFNFFHTLSSVRTGTRQRGALSTKALVHGLYTSSLADSAVLCHPSCKACDGWSPADVRESVFVLFRATMIQLSYFVRAIFVQFCASPRAERDHILR